jgi:hypothetical protein
VTTSNLARKVLTFAPGLRAALAGGGRVPRT